VGCAFYEADEQVRLWGTYLAEELPRIYARESVAVVVFISADYAEAGVYVLPARFDDSELPDVVDIDLRRYVPGQFADLIVEKLARAGYQSVTAERGRQGRGRRPLALGATLCCRRRSPACPCRGDPGASRIGGHTG
jgi:hypothetical protein